jgi:class 3 adenylate cyclase
MKEALARHGAIVRDAIEVRGGHVVKQTGDGFHAVFVSASDAIGLRSKPNSASNGKRGQDARLGFDGATQRRDAGAWGDTTDLRRTARGAVMAVAHGGQIVMSSATAELVMESGFELHELGEHRLAGLSLSGLAGVCSRLGGSFLRCDRWMRCQGTCRVR